MPSSLQSESVKAKNLLYHNTFHGSVAFLSDDKARLPQLDETSAAETIDGRFAEPSCFESAMDELAKSPLLVVAGPAGTGKHALALVCLRRTGHEQILQIAADAEFADICASVEALRDGDKTGFVLADASADLVRSLDAYRAGVLCQTLRGRSASLVLTTEATPSGEPESSAVGVVMAEAPKDDRLVAALLAQDPDLVPHGATLEGAIAAVRCAGFVAAYSLARMVKARPELTVEEVASAFLKSDAKDHMSRWLNTDRSGDEVALLATVAACEYLPESTAHTLSHRLETLFADSDGATPLPRPVAFRSSRAAEIPVELVTVDVDTHFGTHEEKVLRLADPLDPVTVVDSLWTNLGRSFREPLCTWIDELVDHSDPAVRVGIAVTTGILFTVDARLIERHLLRPWALSNRERPMEGAAIALGVPAALGTGMPFARGLARHWFKSGNERLSRCAVLAYGGGLGAWDPGAAAITSLWGVDAEDPLATSWANQSLAQLCVAGPEAAWARAGVLDLLERKVEDRHDRERVFEVLRWFWRFLCTGNGESTASLHALMSEPERASFDAAARLLGQAMVTPPGFPSARLIIYDLLAAVEAGILTFDRLVALVRQMKACTRQNGTIPRFGKNLRRVLIGAIKESESRSSTAQAAFAHFFER